MSRSIESGSFWKSRGVSGYPNFIRIEGMMIVLVGGEEERRFVGQCIRELTGPVEGKILDLGAGNTSGLIHGDNIDRVTAVDFSRVLLHDNPAVNSLQLNLATRNLPDRWSNIFELATVTYLMRYLTKPEQDHLLDQTFKVIQPGGMLVVTEFPDLEVAYLAQLLGEKTPFDPEDFAGRMISHGFENVSIYPREMESYRGTNIRYILLGNKPAI